MNKRRIGFKKGRQLSNILYAISAMFLIWRLLVLENSDPLALPTLGLGIAFFCAGMVLYSKYCRCPNCGMMQPRYIRNRCEKCQTELD